jgi:hypothetical protein
MPGKPGGLFLCFNWYQGMPRHCSDRAKHPRLMPLFFSYRRQPTLRPEVNDPISEVNLLCSKDHLELQATTGNTPARYESRLNFKTLLSKIAKSTFYAKGKFGTVLQRNAPGLFRGPAAPRLAAFPNNRLTSAELRVNCVRFIAAKEAI